jgi:hypothetical protein
MIGGAVAFAVLLGACLILVLPRGRPWQRVAGTGLFILLLALVFGGSAELLGRAKPLRLERRDVASAKVVGAALREGDAIYLWLELPGVPEPRAYVLPWDLRAAEELQQAQAAAEAMGTGVEMANPFAGDRSEDPREPKFYPQPQPAMPEKDYSPAAPVEVQ